MAHTATPWTVEPPNCDDAQGDGRITYKYSVRGPGVPPTISFQICQLSSINSNEADDAAFIVKACNSHDDLVHQLKETLRMLEAAYRELGMSFNGKRVVAAQSALKQAGA